MKKIIIIIITIVIISLSYSCKSKKTVIETHSTDTLRIEKIVKITPAQLNSLVIESPCDSLGNLKPFNYSFGTDKNKVSLNAVNNTIYLTQNLDSIKQVWEKEQRKSTFTSEKTVTIYKTPTWNWKIIGILSIIIAIMSFIIVLLYKSR